jgi:hypothetical protein
MFWTFMPQQRIYQISYMYYRSKYLREDKIDDMKDNFYEDLERVFEKFQK